MNRSIICIDTINQESKAKRGIGVDDSGFLPFVIGITLIGTQSLIERLQSTCDCHISIASISTVGYRSGINQ